MEFISPEKWIKSIGADDNVLLVNPPVQEIRYAWLKWNQPTDLLLLSSKLKTDVGCQVELLDFMLPDNNGRVTTKEYKQKNIKGTLYKSRLYGMSLDVVSKNIDIISSSWKPTHIVITSFTSYWYEPILRLIPFFRTIFPEVKISLIGAFPSIEKEEAIKTGADFIVEGSINFDDNVPDFSIYHNPITLLFNDNKVLNFGGIKYTKRNTVENLIKQVNILLEKRIKNMVIFEDNLMRNDSEILNEFLDVVINEGITINLHGICGLFPSIAKGDIYQKMLNGGFRSFFFEYDLDGQELNIDSYKKIYFDLEKNNTIRKVASGSLGGFVMIGTPKEDLETLFRHSFNILETCGSLIPKPYTPIPGTSEYNRISREYGIEWLSPHAFPMAVTNGISRDDYKEFYQHAAFLNEKRSGNSFDYFDDSHTSIALRKSLGKKVGSL